MDRAILGLLVTALLVAIPASEARTYEGEQPGSPVHCTPQGETSLVVTLDGDIILAVSDASPCLLA